MGSDPKEIAELYAAAFIAVAISSASALAARDVERCISTLNTTMRLAAALGFRFGIGAVEPSPIEMPGEARRDH